MEKTILNATIINEPHKYNKSFEVKSNVAHPHSEKDVLKVIKDIIDAGMFELFKGRPVSKEDEINKGHLMALAIAAATGNLFTNKSKPSIVDEVLHYADFLIWAAVAAGAQYDIMSASIPGNGNSKTVSQEEFQKRINKLSKQFDQEMLNRMLQYNKDK